MSLFERIKNKLLVEEPTDDKEQTKNNKKSKKQKIESGTYNYSKEKKDDGIKKPTKKANKEVFDVTGKSAARDAKKYSTGEYAKIGGGSRIGSKSKGPGAETGAKVNLNPTSGSKSKGTTPVKVNITKPIKQSEVSKKAKEFTTKINKANTNRKEFPGDKSGAYKLAKADIDSKNLIKKAGGSGDIGFTAPDRKTKVAKRTTRAIKQGTPDPFKSKTKFSQKGFEKSLKKFSKGPRTGIDNPFMKSPAGDRFNIGDTKGQMNVKAMNRKAFKKTQPKDVQLPKSFTDFSKKLKTLKTDVAKTASATPRTVTKKFTPTVGVKQAEVSKKIAKDNKAYNLARTKTPVSAKASKNTMSSGKDFITKNRKQAETATTNLRKKVDTIAKNPNLTGRQKAEQSRKVMKDVKTAQNYARGYANPKTAQTAITLPKNTQIVKDAAKGPTPPKPQPFTGVTAKGNPSRAISPSFKIRSQATIKDIAKQKGALKLPKNYKYYAGAKKIAAKSPFAKKAIIGAGKILGKLGTKGRIAAAGLSLAAANPGVRNFVKNTAIFGGLAGALGFAKPNKKVLKVGDGLTKVSNMPSKYQPPGMKSGTFKEPGSNKVRGTGDVRIRYGLTGSKKNKDGTVTPGGRIANPKDVSRVKNIQKNYIDSYNASAKNNPFKKQIKYKVEKDGTYTVTPPKKK